MLNIFTRKKEEEDSVKCITIWDALIKQKSFEIRREQIQEEVKKSGWTWKLAWKARKLYKDIAKFQKYMASL